MKTKQDIQNFVNQLLKDWLVVKSKPLHIVMVTCENPRWAAAVSHHLYKKGLSYHKTMTEIDLNVHKSFFTLSEKVQERIITHEVYHVIQYNILRPEQLYRLRTAPVPENNVSEYSPNMLELEAEVFCINICGESNHSYPEAKYQSLYRATLDRILARQEIFEEIPE